MSVVVVEWLGIGEDARYEFAVDGLELSAGSELEDVGGDAVGVAQAALGVLVAELKTSRSQPAERMR